MKRLFAALTMVVLASSFGNCCSSGDLGRYQTLEQKVKDIAVAMEGEFGEQMRSTFTQDSLLLFLNTPVHKAEYNIVKDYTLDLREKGGKYVLLVSDNGKLVLYDYFCTRDSIDGPVYRLNGEMLLKRMPCP